MAKDDPNKGFSQERYKKNELRGKEFFFADGADAYANRDYVIVIKHVPSGNEIRFKAFITTFNDTYSQDWNSEQVYGRADPIYNFKQTTRNISLAFKMPAASEGEAYDNLTKAQRLSQFMYPNYTDVDGAKTVSQGPLLRIKVMNLLQTTRGTTFESDKTENAIYSSYGNGDEGMLGFCSDVTFNFNLDNDQGGAFEKPGQNGTILPKLIEVSIGSFKPIHEHHLGWNKDGKFGKSGTGEYSGELFPYGAQYAADGAEREGSSFSAIEQRRLEKERAEAAIANAEARYGGMFGNMRRKRDLRRLENEKYKGTDKGYYIASAVAGQSAIDQGITDDTSAINDYYDFAVDEYVE